MTPPQSFDITAILWSLAATVLFVLINGFFVAAEFALVKVRHQRVARQAEQGSKAARLAQRMLAQLNLHLSSCQLGITVSSLILGWLAEPAVARLLLAGAAGLGLQVGQGAALHATALGLALAIVTILHMTIGEQAPKIWAIHRAEAMALRVAYPLRAFTLLFKPLIWVINLISNGLLRLVGLSSTEQHEASLSTDELRFVIATSAMAGHITPRQRLFAENILTFIDLEVRHIMVSRVDVVRLLTRRSAEENLKIIRESGHTRFPLCEEDLDGTIGIVHAKDVLAALVDGQPVDLRALARKPLFVPDTQPLGRMIGELQQARTQSAVVLDDHGTAVGLAYLEDAIEEIVGPIQDEFDDEEPRVRRREDGVVEVRGDLPLPEAVELLGLTEEEDDDDTIGGLVVSRLKRLPRRGDEVIIGSFRVVVAEVARRRIQRLQLHPLEPAGEGKDGDNDEEERS